MTQTDDVLTHHRNVVIPHDVSNLVKVKHPTNIKSKLMLPIMWPGMSLHCLTMLVVSYTL